MYLVLYNYGINQDSKKTFGLITNILFISSFRLGPPIIKKLNKGVAYVNDSKSII